MIKFPLVKPSIWTKLSYSALKSRVVTIQRDMLDHILNENMSDQFNSSQLNRRLDNAD